MKQRSENQTRLLDIFKSIIKFEVDMLRFKSIIKFEVDILGGFLPKSSSSESTSAEFCQLKSY